MPFYLLELFLHVELKLWILVYPFSQQNKWPFSYKVEQLGASLALHPPYWNVNENYHFRYVILS